MNEKLRHYVTQTAFSMSLSKTHITALAAIYHGDNTMAYSMSLWVPATRGIEKRGLITWHGDDNPPKGFVWQKMSGYIDRNAAYRGQLSFTERYRLTKAGQLTAELLIEAGMMPAKLCRDGVMTRANAR